MWQNICFVYFCVYICHANVKIMENVIGNNLKVLRENSGYTQKQISEFLGINRSAYANYESGERVAPMNVLEGVAKLFGVDLAVLFEEDAAKVQSMLLCAFRAEGLSVEDMKQVAEFKDVAMSYLKMVKLLGDE